MALSSSLASISFGGTTIAAVGTFTVSLSRNALEATSIGDNAQNFIAGIGGATATLDIFYDQASAGHTALENAINNGTTTASAVVITAASLQTYSGNAFVTGFEITAQAGSLTRASVTLQFTTASPGATIVTIA